LSATFGIKAEGLSKQYRITRASTGTRRRLAPRRGRREIFWALRDLDFEVPRGSTLGVIGRNGAGKTTLLKLLSRVTAPTGGQALISGRVSSLLEVGTGFHPELTGRENVYLNGAILGMRRREIDAKFDDIVTFSEIGQFIDTPIKRYSTGMGLRLAFAVAAHLEPDVLLVDEVLAVGDASFQAKCLGKMGDMVGEGRTVVLVSHNMPTIASLADRCLWLERGELRYEGATDETIRRYIAESTADSGGVVDLRGNRNVPPAERREVRFTEVRLRDDRGTVRGNYFEGEPLTLEVDIESDVDARQLEVRAYVKTLEGVWLFSSLMPKHEVRLGPGRYRVSTRIDPNHLAPGTYRFDLGMQTGVPQDLAEDAIRVQIDDSPDGHDNPILRGHMGHLRFPYRWSEPEPLDA
jgi:lipopolysaccharide transport system ATP-binding protein